MERYSGRKRRAAADDDDYEQHGEEEDESEEQKVEKFFALISSTREARDRLRGETHDRNNKLKEEDEEVKKQQQQQQQAAWNPTFLPQDFVHTMDEKNRHMYNMISIPPLPVPSQKFISEEQDEKGKDDGGLNLRLSLSL